MDEMFNRMSDRKALEDILGGGIREYIRTQETYVPPPEDPPVAVDHEPPPQAHRVNFIVHGTADYGPRAYRGPSREQVEQYLVDAIQNVHGGPRWWLPEVYFEIAEMWDYTGEDHAKEPESRAPEVAAISREDFDFLVENMANIDRDNGKLWDQIQQLQRDLDNERAARNLEAAVRPHGGDSRTGATVHGGDEQAVPDGAEQRDRNAGAGRDGTRGKRSRARSGDRSADRPTDRGEDSGAADAGEIRGDPAPVATPVVAPGYIPVNPRTGEEL